MSTPDANAPSVEQPKPAETPRASSQPPQPQPSTDSLPKGSLLFAGSSPMAMKKAPAPTSVANALPSIAQTAASRAPLTPKTYEGFVEHVRKFRPAIANALENAICDHFPAKPEDDFIVLFSPENASLYQALLTSTSALSELQKFTTEFLGLPKRVLVEVRETGRLSAAEQRERDLANREKSAKEAVANHPIISEARALFGGELGPIELMRKDEGERK